MRRCRPHSTFARCMTATSTLHAGNTCAHADATARAVIADAGYGAAFRHRLGHGIGMDVHEPPFLTSNDTTVLRPGMCFTVEPRIFIPHQPGCRVEHVVVVRTDGGEPLTNGFQELLVFEYFRATSMLPEPRHRRGDG